MSQQPELSPQSTPAESVRSLYHPLHQQRLIRANQVLLLAMIALMTVVILLSSFLLSSHDLVSELKEKQAVESTSAAKNPALNVEVDALKGQLIGLVSHTIETKLKSLEKNIERGRPLTALETVKSLKDDVSMLRSYAKPLLPLALEQTPEPTESTKVLIQEVSQLKSLIYMTLGSSSLMLVALSGIWLKSRRQLARYPAHYLDKTENPNS
jgi:hypothetical protein